MHVFNLNLNFGLDEKTSPLSVTNLLRLKILKGLALRFQA
jgi:hypothetical protein